MPDAPTSPPVLRATAPTPNGRDVSRHEDLARRIAAGQDPVGLAALYPAHFAGPGGPDPAPVTPAPPDVHPAGGPTAGQVAQDAPEGAPLPRGDALIREYGQKTMRKRELQAELRVINKRLTQLEEPLLAEFDERQIRSQRIAGVGLVGLKRDARARIKGYSDDLSDEEKAALKDKAAKALKAAGLGQYVTEGFNLNTISALAREWAESGEDPPEELVAVFHLDPFYKPSVTK